MPATSESSSHWFIWFSVISFAGAQAASRLLSLALKHFPKEPFIVTPAEMLTIINEMTAESGRILNAPATPYGK